jgi:phosphocarrier protein
MFVQTANRFSSALQVSRAGVEPVNGKSIMGIMMLAAEHGTMLELVADGEDAASMIEALARLVESGFDED